MSISREDVQNIADLARIELTDVEIEKFQKNLSAILDFVEQLNALETKDVIPLAGGTVNMNIMRPDEQTDTYMEGKSAEFVQQAPDKKNGWVRVKAVFE